MNLKRNMVWMVMAAGALWLAACAPGSPAPSAAPLAPLPTPWARQLAALPTATAEALPPPGSGKINPGIAEPLAGAGQAVTIGWGGPAPLRGLYHAPSGQAAAPALLLLPMQNAVYAAWGDLPEAAQARGFAVLHADLDYSGLPGAASDLDRQARAALDWLAQQPGVDGQRLYVAGAGLGANLALRLSNGQARVAGVALFSLPPDGYGLATPQKATLPPVWLAAADGDAFSLKEEDLAPTHVTRVKVEGKTHGANLLEGNPGLGGEMLDWMEK